MGSKRQNISAEFRINPRYRKLAIRIVIIVGTKRDHEDEKDRRITDTHLIYRVRDGWVYV